MEDVRLYISVASNREWKGGFGSALSSLISYLTANGTNAEGYNLTHFYLRAYGQASCLSMARQSFVDEAISGDFTHHLSLDDDMTFPMDIVDKLLAHGKSIVSVNTRHKTDDVKGSLNGMDGQRLDSTGKTGLEEIRTMGGAIYLAKVDAFRNIMKPHYQVLWSESHQDYISEDIHFSALLRGNGVKLWCDHDVSQEIGHIGDYEYKWPKVEQAKISLVA